MRWFSDGWSWVCHPQSKATDFDLILKNEERNIHPNREAPKAFKIDCPPHTIIYQSEGDPFSPNKLARGRSPFIARVALIKNRAPDSIDDSLFEKILFALSEITPKDKVETNNFFLNIDSLPSPKWERGFNPYKVEQRAAMVPVTVRNSACKRNRAYGLDEFESTIRLEEAPENETFSWKKYDPDLGGTVIVLERKSSDDWFVKKALLKGRRSETIGQRLFEEIVNRLSEINPTEPGYHKNLFLDIRELEQTKELGEVDFSGYRLGAMDSQVLDTKKNEFIPALSITMAGLNHNGLMILASELRDSGYTVHAAVALGEMNTGEITVSGSSEKLEALHKKIESIKNAEKAT